MTIAHDRRDMCSVVGVGGVVILFVVIMGASMVMSMIGIGDAQMDRAMCDIDTPLVNPGKIQQTDHRRHKHPDRNDCGEDTGTERSMESSQAVHVWGYQRISGKVGMNTFPEKRDDNTVTIRQCSGRPPSRR